MLRGPKGLRAQGRFIQQLRSQFDNWKNLSEIKLEQIFHCLSLGFIIRGGDREPAPFERPLDQ